MDRLRVGGACWFEGTRQIVSWIGEMHGKPCAQCKSGQGAVHSPDYIENGRVIPAPFIPGDVVEHSSKPEWGRGLVLPEWNADAEGDGRSHHVVWQDGSGWDGPAVQDTDLTLILPAQPAQEAQHG